MVEAKEEVRGRRKLKLRQIKRKKERERGEADNALSSSNGSLAGSSSLSLMGASEKN